MKPISHFQDPSGRITIELENGGMGRVLFGIRYISNSSVEIYVKRSLLQTYRFDSEYEVGRLITHNPYLPCGLC